MSYDDLCQARRSMLLLAKLGGFALQFSCHECYQWFAVEDGGGHEYLFSIYRCFGHHIICFIYTQLGDRVGKGIKNALKCSRVR